MRNNGQNGHMVKEMLIGQAIFWACMLLIAAFTSCAASKPSSAEVKSHIATTTATVSAVASSTAIALVALCEPNDTKCKDAIKALAAIGAATGAIGPTLNVQAAPERKQCIPPQAGRTLLSGEAFCE